MELVIKKSATPSFVSMWPSNVELPLMATEVSKRKHILEFPLFKRTENQTKLKLSKENIGWKKSYTTQTHTLKHTHTEYYAYVDTHE